MEEFETLTLDEKMLIFLMRKENINPASVFACTVDVISPSLLLLVVPPFATQFQATKVCPLLFLFLFVDEPPVIVKPSDVIAVKFPLVPVASNSTPVVLG
jgi:hypothetical protein